MVFKKKFCFLFFVFLGFQVKSQETPVVSYKEKLLIFDSNNLLGKDLDITEVTELSVFNNYSFYKTLNCDNSTSSEEDIFMDIKSKLNYGYDTDCKTKKVLKINERPFLNVKWTILKDKKKILGYQCVKATCFAYGAEYTAWFAPELKYATGPVNFNGLPGLIFEITSEHSSYKATEIKFIDAKNTAIFNIINQRTKNEKHD
jgi:GLPGLI family protein